MGAAVCSQSVDPDHAAGACAAPAGNSRATGDPLTDVIEVLHADLALADARATALLRGAGLDDQAPAAGQPGRTRVLAGAILRVELARRLALRPAEVLVVREPDGKPRLAGDHPPLHFSLSHSGTRALLAFGRRAPLGVDLEAVDARRAHERIAARWFSPAEHRRIAALCGGERARAFCALWAAKEACVKATGEGLAALGAVTVEGEVARWSHPRLGFDRWRVAPLSLGEGWEGAVAAPGEGWRATLREWCL
jgi:4'-phosphopantetheinyl transferase